MQDGTNRDIIIRKIVPHQSVYKNPLNYSDKGGNPEPNQNKDQSFFNVGGKKEEEQKLINVSNGEEQSKKEVSTSIFDIGF